MSKLYGIVRTDGKYYAGEYILPLERVPYWNSLLSSATRFNTEYDAQNTLELLQMRRDDKCEITELPHRAAPLNLSIDF